MMDEHFSSNWQLRLPRVPFLGQSICQTLKLDMRINPTAYEIAKQQEEEFHAAVAERRLQEEGIKPELNLYLIGIGGMAR
jgi:hypothetical protein